MFAKDKQEPQEVVKNLQHVYIPKHRSGAYAILLALYNSNSARFIESELLEQATSLCNGVVMKDIKVLSEKGCINIDGTPPTYTLTRTGVSIGKMLANEIKILESVDAVHGC